MCSYVNRDSPHDPNLKKQLVRNRVLRIPETHVNGVFKVPKDPFNASGEFLRSVLRLIASTITCCMYILVYLLLGYMSAPDTLLRYFVWFDWSTTRSASRKLESSYTTALGVCSETIYNDFLETVSLSGCYGSNIIHLVGFRFRLFPSDEWCVPNSHTSSYQMIEVLPALISIHADISHGFFDVLDRFDSRLE
ncbi:hypothetical protein Tco_1541430 [Tanacetum coccineum]